MDSESTMPATLNPNARPSLLARGLRRARILTGTALVGAIAFGAVWLGTSVIAGNTVRIAVDEAAAPITVRVTAITVQDSYAVGQEFIGRVEPRQDSELGFENGGTIAALLVDEGDHVKKGQILATLDTRTIKAQLSRQAAAHKALAAQMELAKLTYDRQQALAERSFASQQRADETRLAVTELEARLAESNAAITEIEVALDKASLRAPFDGLVAVRHVDGGTRVSSSAPILELQEDAAPQLRIGLSSAVAARLTPQDRFDVAIGGATYTARFISRQAELNPITRTLPVLFDLDLHTDSGTDSPPLSFGSVVRLCIDRDVPERGAWVPLSALSEGPRGLWALFVIDTASDTNTETVAREAVEVIYAHEDRAFVRGALDDGARIIVTGTHRIAPGQTVRAAEG